MAPSTDSSEAETTDDDRVRQRVRARCDRDQDGRWTVHVDPSDTWVHAEPQDARLPPQGWKLHVSAGLSSADDVLSKALDVLVDEGVTFKVARSRSVLDALNWGHGGRSQIGKFMTVYPVDDAQAVRIAEALHTATVGERGPRIPSDRPLVAGSIVHYRYGSFTTRYARLPSGEVVPVIEDPDGALIADERRIAPPTWAEDPFIRASSEAAARPGNKPTPTIGGRFVLTGTMMQTARGSVFLAVDLDGPQRCIVKHARRDSLLSASGADARDRLRAEAATLAHLGDEGPWPRLLALVDDGDDVYLVEDEIRGTNLARLITTRIASGRHVGPAVIVRWGIDIANALDRIHACGLIVRDLKAANVMVAAPTDGDDTEGAVRLIDLECARAGAPTPDGTLGTRGSCSPEQRRGDAPAVADDVFALGALLWFMATGADPAMAPDATAIGDRSLAQLRPELDGPLAMVITTCLADDPHHRYAGAAEVAAALARTMIVADRARSGHIHAVPADAPSRSVWENTARAIGTVLVNRAGRRADGHVSWQPTAGLPLTDLARGDAGVVLALSALARRFPDSGIGLHESIHAGARGLLRPSVFGGEPSPALFSGENGVALAILAAGTILADPSLIDAAEARAEALIARPHVGFDLFDGSAGRARSMLWWHQATGESRWLDAACAAGEHLVAQAQPLDLGGGRGWGRWWTAAVPPDDPGSTGPRPGYASGAAGIADALLQLYASTGDERFRDTGFAALRGVVAATVPALDSDRGITWPIVAGEPDLQIAWCHGATCIATALLRARNLGRGTDAADLDMAHLEPHVDDPGIGRDLDGLITAAVVTVASGTRASDCTQRDGLAGSLELLLDVAASDHPAANGVAPAIADLADLLLAFVPSADRPDRIAPSSGYLDGLSGVLAVALRLAAPTVPGLLGPRWWFTADGRARSASAVS